MLGTYKKYSFFSWVNNHVLSAYLYKKRKYKYEKKFILHLDENLFFIERDI